MSGTARPATTAQAVAEWFIGFANNTLEDEADVSNLKLQKLLYYAQGHWLAEHDGTPLFSEKFKAWSHGPVIPEIYHLYRGNGRNPIPNPHEDDDWASYTPEMSDFLERVWAEYGGYAPVVLRNKSHATKPWIDAFQEPERSPAISAKAMEDWFRAHPLPA